MRNLDNDPILRQSYYNRWIKLYIAIVFVTKVHSRELYQMARFLLSTGNTAYCGCSIPYEN